MKTALWVSASVAGIAGLCWWWKKHQAQAGTSAASPDPTKNPPYAPIIPSINGSFAG